MRQPAFEHKPGPIHMFWWQYLVVLLCLHNRFCMLPDFSLFVNRILNVTPSIHHSWFLDFPSSPDLLPHISSATGSHERFFVFHPFILLLPPKVISPSISPLSQRRCLFLWPQLLLSYHRSFMCHPVTLFWLCRHTPQYVQPSFLRHSRHRI